MHVLDFMVRHDKEPLFQEKDAICSSDGHPQTRGGPVSFSPGGPDCDGEEVGDDASSVLSSGGPYWDERLGE